MKDNFTVTVRQSNCGRGLTIHCGQRTQYKQDHRKSILQRGRHISIFFYGKILISSVLSAKNQVKMILTPFRGWYSRLSNSLLLLLNKRGSSKKMVPFHQLESKMTHLSLGLEWFLLLFYSY